MKVGVLDLGTNTFNILVAEYDESGTKIIPLYSEECPVKLGRDGIHMGYLVPEALIRGLSTLEYFKKILDEHAVDKILAIATSAIRTAQNGTRFIKTIADTLHIEVRLVSGDEEADLVYKGVQQALPGTCLQKSLILDIGGGSLEFIFVESGQSILTQSIEIGTARILDQFKPSNIIKPAEIDFIEQTLHSHLLPLLTDMKAKKPNVLIGASGAFDTFRDLLATIGSEYKSLNPYLVIRRPAFESLYQTLIHSSLDDRLRMKGLPDFRAEMIVIAAIIVNFVVHKFEIESIIQSDFALKEGVAIEWKRAHNL